MKIESLFNLCLDKLELPAEVKSVLFEKDRKDPRDIIEIDLNYNNRTTTVENTLSKTVEVPVKLKKKRGYVSRIVLDISNLHFLQTIELWFLIKMFHTTERNSVVFPALRYRVLRPNVIGINDLVKLLDAPTFLKLVPYLKDWGTPESSPYGHNELCRSARDSQTDAPCMVVFKKPMDEWCPICIYRWAEYDERYSRHKKCCKGSSVKNWCESCLKMRADVGWASMAHLL